MDFAVDWKENVNFDRMRSERVRRLNEQMKSEGLDALLYFKVENLRYMTGGRLQWWPISNLTRNAGIMVPDKEPIFFPTSGCAERLQETMYWMRKENIRPLATMEDPGIAEAEVKNKLKPAFEELGVTKGRIGIDHVPMTVLLKLQEALPEAEFVNGDTCVLRASAEKTNDEINLMRQASQLAAFAMNRAMKVIEPGVRECEVLAEAMHSLYSNSMEAPQCSLIVTSGDGTAPLRRFGALSMGISLTLPVLLSVANPTLSKRRSTKQFTE
jgi:Xaa-Pro aminopeptidase